MKRFLCVLLVLMMITPCAFAESAIEESFLNSMFGEKPISEYSTGELEMMVSLFQFAEEYIQSEIDSRTKNTVIPTATPEPEKSTGPSKLKINGTKKEVNVEGIGVTMQYAYTESRSGKDYLIIVFSAKNNTSDSTSFGFTINIEAYQNGVELGTGFLYGIETNSTTKFRPGSTIEGKAIFELTNTTAQVEIELNKLWNFTNEKPALYTVDLK